MGIGAGSRLQGIGQPCPSPTYWVGVGDSSSAIILNKGAWLYALNLLHVNGNRVGSYRDMITLSS